MKIVHISTYDIIGGAALSAYQLCKAISNEHQDAVMLVKKRYSQDPIVREVMPQPLKGDLGKDIFVGACFQHYLNWKKKRPEFPLFSFPYPGYDLAGTDTIKNADILHIHWTSGFLSPYTFKRLLSLGKKVVITCHDQRTFTGGCHCVGDCREYAQNCAPCPQIKNDSLNIPGVLLEESRTILKKYPIHVVTPSHWLKKLISKSILFKSNRVTCIPNSVDTNLFRPGDREASRNELKIPAKAFVILFGAATISQEIKGLNHLVRAMELCKTKSRTFSRKQNQGKVILLTFGNAPAQAVPSTINHISLGYILSPKKIRQAYCAADYLCLPSLEDNFPNTMVEAMSCGVPVIGYETGGIPEMVNHGETGLTAPKGDIDKLSDCICLAFSGAVPYKKMSQQCQKQVMMCCSPSLQAKRHIQLYHTLLAGNKNHKNIETEHSLHNDSVQIDFRLTPYFNSFINKIVKKVSHSETEQSLVFINSLLEMDIEGGVKRLPDGAVPHFFSALVDILMLIKELGQLESVKNIYDFAAGLFSRVPLNQITMDSLLRFTFLSRAFTNPQLVLGALSKAADLKNEYFSQIKTIEGILLNDLGKFSEAVDSYTAVLSSEPDNFEIRKKILDVLIRLKRYDKALACIEQGLEYKEIQFDMLKAKVEVFLMAGRDEAATATIKKMEHLFPSEAGSYIKVQSKRTMSRGT